MPEYRLVRNRCHVHSDSRDQEKRIAAGRLERHTVLTVESHDKIDACRLSCDNCTHCSTLEDPAILTSDDLRTLALAVAQKDRLPADALSAITQGIAAIHALPRPEKPTLVYQFVSKRYYILVPDSVSGWVRVVPWSLALNRHRWNEAGWISVWEARHWRIVPQQPDLSGKI